MQTSWRDSGYERFALVWKPKCIRQPKMQLPSSSYNHNTLTSLITSVNESLQMHFKVAGDSPTDILRVVSILCAKLGSCILG